MHSFVANVENSRTSNTRIDNLQASSRRMRFQDRPMPIRLIPPGPSAERSDAELLAGLQADVPWARRELWDRYSGRVRRYLSRALGRPSEDVEDLTQEVFLRVFVRRRGIHTPEALGTFTMSVAVRVLKWHLRALWIWRRIHHLADDGDLPEPSGDRIREEEARDALQRCRAILDALGARERIAFTLRVMEEMKIEEVAATMKVSESTAKRLVNRATAIIAERVGQDEGLRQYFLDRTGGGR
jgi:RNA polymerase sigma-70 factor (ECF subfamily)